MEILRLRRKIKYICINMLLIMRVRYLLILLLILTAEAGAFGQQWKQSRFELLGGISVNQLFGDVGGAASTNTLFGLKDITFSAMRPGIALGTRYEVERRIQIKALASSGYMVASDKGSRNENRRLEASVLITDFAITGEYYIVVPSENKSFSIMAVRGGVRPYGRTSYGIYVYGGVGGAYYTSTGNATLKASPRYIGGSGITAIMPIGVGVKVNLIPRLAFNGELGARMSFSDKLDAYTSPFSKSNDIYYTLTLGVSYKIIVKRTPGRRWIF